MAALPRQPGKSTTTFNKISFYFRKPLLEEPPAAVRGPRHEGSCLAR